MKNILVVDDESEICSVLSAVLASCASDYIVFIAHDGKEAVCILETTRVDILLTDLNMPLMSGFELVAYVKEHHPEMKIIAMSGIDHPELPFNDIPYIHKPFNLQDLAKTISALA